MDENTAHFKDPQTPQVTEPAVTATEDPGGIRTALDPGEDGPGPSVIRSLVDDCRESGPPGHLKPPGPQDNVRPPANPSPPVGALSEHGAWAVPTQCKGSFFLMPV